MSSVQQVSIVGYYSHFYGEAVRIEEELGFSARTRFARKRRYLKGRYAISVLLFLILLFWVYAMVGEIFGLETYNSLIDELARASTAVFSKG